MKDAILATKLYYRYGAMNSGKSTALLQVAFNYEERGQRVLIAKPTIDTKDEYISSRLGAKRYVDIQVSPSLNLLTHFEELVEKTGIVDCLIVDEAQFLTRDQVTALFMIAETKNTPVLAYGLRSDFQGNAFPGSARLMELAHSLEELKTICRCGRKALFNGRKIDGKFVSLGDQVAIDGQQAEYESLCGKCYLDKVGLLV